jgi:hypothetical protein
MIFSSIVFAALALPAVAMDMGCSPAAKVSARTPAEAHGQTAEAKATPVTGEMRSEAVRTAAAPKAEDKSVQ